MSGSTIFKQKLERFKALPVQEPRPQRRPSGRPKKDEQIVRRDCNEGGFYWDRDKDVENADAMTLFDAKVASTMKRVNLHLL